MRKLKIFEHISLDGVIQVRGSGEDGDYLELASTKVLSSGIVINAYKVAGPLTNQP